MLEIATQRYFAILLMRASQFAIIRISQSKPDLHVRYLKSTANRDECGRRARASADSVPGCVTYHAHIYRSIEALLWQAGKPRNEG